MGQKKMGEGTPMEQHWGKIVLRKASSKLNAMQHKQKTIKFLCEKFDSV